MLSWSEKAALAEAPEVGRISLLSEEMYAVVANVEGSAGTVVRSLPTFDFGEDRAVLPLGTVLTGHSFGKWLRLSSVRLPSGEEQAFSRDEEFWTPIRLCANPLRNAIVTTFLT